MKILEILLEYNRDITKQKIGDKLSVAGQKDRNVDIDTILQTLEEIDPTPNKQYVLWLANQYMKNLFRLEDKNRVKDVLQKFMQVKSRLPEKDIGRYTFHTLQDKMDELFNVQLSTKPTEHEQQTFQVPKGVKVLYNGPLGLLAIPLSYKASCILGSGTKWCTAATDDPIDARNTFLNYTKDGPLYIWRDKNGEKYQFHFDWYNGELQFMDSKDRDIPTKKLNYFRNEHPVLKKMFEKEELKYFTNMSDFYPASIMETLKKYSEQVGLKRFPLLEKMIIDRCKKYPKDTDLPKLIYLYSKNFKLHLPEMDEILLKLPVNHDTLYYHKSILQSKKWPELEQLIKKKPNLAVQYAENRKERFPEAEKYIASQYSSARDYIFSVLQKPWPEAEQSLLAVPSTAIMYAIRYLKKRWPKLEKILIKDFEISALRDYANYFKIDILDDILKSYPIYLLKYLEYKNNYPLWQSLLPELTKKEKSVESILKKYPKLYAKYKDMRKQGKFNFLV